MGRFICKLEGKYFEYSTIVDAPITRPMTLERFSAYYRDEYGASGSQDFAERLARADAKGTSSHLADSFEEVILLNRAGDGETAWTLDQFKRWARGET